MITITLNFLKILTDGIKSVPHTKSKFRCFEYRLNIDMFSISNSVSTTRALNAIKREMLKIVEFDNYYPFFQGWTIGKLCNNQRNFQNLILGCRAGVDSVPEFWLRGSDSAPAGQLHVLAQFRRKVGCAPIFEATGKIQICFLFLFVIVLYLGQIKHTGFLIIL